MLFKKYSDNYIFSLLDNLKHLEENMSQSDDDEIDVSKIKIISLSDLLELLELMKDFLYAVSKENRPGWLVNDSFFDIFNCILKINRNKVLGSPIVLSLKEIRVIYYTLGDTYNIFNEDIGLLGVLPPYKKLWDQFNR